MCLRVVAKNIFFVFRESENFQIFSNFIDFFDILFISLRKSKKFDIFHVFCDVCVEIMQQKVRKHDPIGEIGRRIRFSYF